MKCIVWLRRDLRIHDHPALYQACLEGNDGVLAVYIIDKEMWKRNDTSERQVSFILDGLRYLKAQLAAIGVFLMVCNAKSTQKIPAILYRLVDEYKIQKIFWNQENEFNESIRDESVKKLMASKKISYKTFNDQLIVDASLIYNNSGLYFKVFTPFRKKWLEIVRQNGVKEFPVPKHVKPLNNPLKTNDFCALLNENSYVSSKIFPAGEKEALRRLRKFCDKMIFSYDLSRDFPSLNETSHLSPYIAVGMLSPKRAFQQALLANHGELHSGNRGAIIFMSELIWREFYRHIVIHVPHVSRGRPFRLDTEVLPWNKNILHLKLWQNGQTGFPFVDAGMRQLNKMGWMHNRMRMVTAMFLSKNLLLDWRLGEKYFAKQLVDFDFSSNNGGWQWSASTGTDAVPWFRLFNPILQGRRYDKEGNFIREYCPELAQFNNKEIHDPWRYNPHLAGQVGYPKPMIDLAVSRQKVLSAFSHLKFAR